MKKRHANNSPLVYKPTNMGVCTHVYGHAHTQHNTHTQRFQELIVLLVGDYIDMHLIISRQLSNKTKVTGLLFF